MNEIMRQVVEAAAAKFMASASGLPPGEYDLDGMVITIRLSGKAKKGEKVEYIPKAEIPVVAALALALQRAGVQREGTIDAIVAAMIEAVEAAAKGEEYIKLLTKDVEAATEFVNRKLDAMPKKTREGAFTTGKVKAEVQVSDAKLEAAVAAAIPTEAAKVEAK